MQHRYYVKTWDIGRQAYTAQKGVRTGPYTLFGLRQALRKLKEFGFDADKSDCSTLVFRKDVPEESYCEIASRRLEQGVLEYSE